MLFRRILFVFNIISHEIKCVRGIGTCYSLRNNCGVFYTTEYSVDQNLHLRLLEMQTKRIVTHFRCSADSTSACERIVFIALPYASAKYIRYEAAYASIMHE